ARRWISEGLVHFVASEEHNTLTRPLRLRPAYDVVADQFGEETAQALFHDNPLAAFEGRPLPHVPEVAEELPPPRRKRFFFFRNSSYPKIQNHRAGRRGRPAHIFKTPRTSRTTSRASLVVRHQCRGSNESLDAARTMARPWPGTSLRQSRRTRRVWTFVVTRITASPLARASDKAATLTSSAVFTMGGSRM